MENHTDPQHLSATKCRKLALFAIGVETNEDGNVSSDLRIELVDDTQFPRTKLVVICHNVHSINLVDPMFRGDIILEIENQRSDQLDFGKYRIRDIEGEFFAATADRISIFTKE